MLSPANYFQFEQEGECEFLSSRLIGLPRNSPRHGDAALPSGFGQGGSELKSVARRKINR
jgi:hypothetical protein